MTYTEMLDQLTKRAGSERRASNLFEISPTAFNAWRRRRALPDDEQARRLAELLQLDVAYVLAVIHGERAKSDATRAAWRRVAETFGFDKARAVRTPPARRARNTQCSTARRQARPFTDVVLQSLGLAEQPLAL